jgi:hypothetical protein
VLFLRMLICLAPVLAFGASTARAEGFAPFNRTGSPAYTPVCAKISGGATEPNAGAYALPVLVAAAGGKTGKATRSVSTNATIE